MDAVREVLFDIVERSCLGVDPLILDQDNPGLKFTKLYEWVSGSLRALIAAWLEAS